MKTLSLFKVLILVSLAAASTACATAFHGTRQDIRITSEPSGAMVVIGSKVYGPTPTVVSVSRRSSPTLQFQLNGYEPLTMPVKKSVSGLVALDTVSLNPFSCQGLSSTGSCPGLLIANAATFFGIDFLSGAAFKFPKTVNGVLITR
jgi:hypothetical protein